MQNRYPLNRPQEVALDPHMTTTEPPSADSWTGRNLNVGPHSSLGRLISPAASVGLSTIHQPPQTQQQHHQGGDSHLFASPPHVSLLPEQQQQHRAPPLVLDPSSFNNESSIQHTNLELTAARTTSMGKGGVALVGKIFGRRRNAVPAVRPMEEPIPNQDTAASFARTAPMAGYLQKLGSNIPQFKRRFFVLKPTTLLYYFLSPNDVEPHGCIDLEGVRVRERENLPDGRFRFELLLQGEGSILLEARSEQVGKEWMTSLNMERLSYAKNEINRLMIVETERNSKINELEHQLEDYRHTERDRDGALEDAAQWKRKFEQLDNSMRLLTQHIRKPSSTENIMVNKHYGGANKKGPVHDDATQLGEIIKHEERGNDNAIKSVQSNHNEASQRKNDNDILSTAPNDKLDFSAELSPRLNIIAPSQKETSLLDSTMLDDDEDLDIDDIAVPAGSKYFSALSNACQQLRENVQLASIEASTAVEDLTTANGRTQILEKRMTKAEKHLCKLWEENCEMRKTLKLRKKEKKVLVREVKSLLAVSRNLKDISIRAPNNPEFASKDSSLVIEEERLINELEEHVMSSIKLHEQLLSANGGAIDQAVKKKSTVVLEDEATIDSASKENDMIETARGGDENEADKKSVDGSTEDRHTPMSVIASLMDMDSDDTNDEGDDESTSPLLDLSFVSLVATPTIDERYKSEDASKTDSVLGLRSQKECATTSARQTSRIAFEDIGIKDRVNDDESSGEENQYPMIALDQDDDSLVTSSVCTEGSSKPTITDNGKATTRLVCPLADVVQTQENEGTDNTNNKANEDGRVYHLTFYSRKIGIQFQKVPPPMISNGILTDAMTADLGDAVEGKTASELRRISEISSLAKSTHERSDGALGGTTTEGLTCRVATPIDAVLVCGFQGFDDTTHQTRPKLGARLVAFDGMSVEIGRWTFDSIRKAIQARGRPMTLSFRNDFLTTAQRSILTKAVGDVDRSFLPPRPSTNTPRISNYTDRVPDSVSTYQSDEQSEPHILPFDDFHQRQRQDQEQATDDDDLYSVSVNSSSIASDTRSSDNITRRGRKRFSFREKNSYSFSDAGSSAIVQAAIGPLMANLMSGLSKKTDPKSPHDTPRYLNHGDAESLDETPHHRDFKAGLL